MSPTIRRLLQEWHIEGTMKDELIHDIVRLNDLNREIAALCRCTDDLETIAYVEYLWDERDALRAKWDGIGIDEVENE